MKSQLIAVVVVACFVYARAFGQDFVTERNTPGAFPVVAKNSTAAIYTDDSDYFLVRKAAALLQQDIQLVTDKKPAMLNSWASPVKNMIIIGSLERSGLIRQLIKDKKLAVDSLQGQWEAYKLQVIHHPFKGVDNALVIAGSDRRGAAYWVFSLSKKLG